MEYILELDMQVVNDFMDDDKTPASGAKKKADEINRNIRAAKESS